MFTENTIDAVLVVSDMLVRIDPSLPEVTNTISSDKSIVVEEPSEPEILRSLAAPTCDSTYSTIDFAVATLSSEPVVAGDNPAPPPIEDVINAEDEICDTTIVSCAIREVSILADTTLNCPWPTPEEVIYVLSYLTAKEPVLPKVTDPTLSIAPPALPDKCTPRSSFNWDIFDPETMSFFPSCHWE